MGVGVEGLFPGLPVEDVVALGLRGDEVADGGAEERAKGFGEVGADVAAALDVDALEERLVDLPPECRVGLEVCRVAVFEELEGGDEVRLAGVVLELGAAEPVADLAEGVADAVLLALEEVEGDGFRVVGLQELVALGQEPLLALEEPLTLVGCLSPDGLELQDQGSFDGLAKLGLELVLRVDVLDLVLDVLDEHGAEGTARELVVASRADVVRVDLAGSASRVGDEEAAAAAAAEDSSLEVVVALPLLRAGVVLSAEDVLGSLPHLGRHERLVRALVLDAPVADESFVVRVAQAHVEQGLVDWLLRPDGAWHGGEAALVELVAESADAPGTFRVGLERPLHERAADGIDLDGADLAAVDDAADVAVAERRFADGAAALRLLD